MDTRECVRCHQQRPVKDFKRTGAGVKKTCDPCVIAKRAATNAAKKAAAQAVDWLDATARGFDVAALLDITCQQCTREPVRVEQPDLFGGAT
ncbi:hypothetical protein [Euzebya sp.]|uniref:hypothetical protein n=1 Tax=Euzebya sp. TaxID=1971409 RepID=UPI003511282F